MAADLQFDTPDALAASVKAQYPAYKSWDNTTLAKSILDKYPTYWKNVNAGNFAVKGLWQPSSTATPTTSTGQGAETKTGKFIESANKQLVGALPTMGMLAGGVVGAPGVATGAAGAAAGAGLGKIAQDVIEEKEGMRPKAAPTEAAKSIAGETALGAASELGGRVAAKALEKGAAAVAPKLSAAAAKILAKVIKPSARRLIAGQGRAETARQVADEVSKVAGSATSLSQLGENVTKAIDNTTATTDQIVSSYKPQEFEVPVSQSKPAPTVGSSGSPTVPGNRTLTAGGESLPTGRDITPSGAGGIGPAAQPGIAGATASTTPITAKVFIKQGQINLNRILQRSARSAADNLSDTEFPDKTRLVKRAARMIARHAGSSDLSPSDALNLRRWLRRDMRWPRALNGMRDDIYSELNRQIGSFLSPEDRAIFEANNAKVHRLILGKDAIDSAQHRALINPTRMMIHGGVGGWAGYEVGGRKGALIGATAGALSGSVPVQLGEAAAARGLSTAAEKTVGALAMPMVKSGAEKAASAAIMESNQ